MKKFIRENRLKIGLLLLIILSAFGWFSYVYWYLPLKHFKEGWVDPEMIAGRAICPEGYLIKANTNSHIYHFPRDPYYTRTNTSVKCFDSLQDAEQQGFRASYGTPRIPTGPSFSYDGKYQGGYAPDGSFCDYGYNYSIKGCCNEDDYSCEIRDRAPQGTTATCKDGSYTSNQDPNSGCLERGGLGEFIFQ